MTQRRRWWTDGVPIGRVLGVPVLIAPSWLLSVLLIMYVGAPVVAELVPGLSRTGEYLVAAALGVFLGLSVLLHELGHCVVARRAGVPVRSLRLYLLGGVTEVTRLPRSPGEEARIAGAGPIVSVLLTALCAAAIPFTEPRTVTWLLVIQLCLSNGLIAVFNLVPALPLDGGRVLRAAIWRLTGRRGAGSTAGRVGGHLVAVVLLGWAVFVLVSGGRGALLQAAVAAVMAAFMVAGAVGERSAPEPPRAASEPEVLAGLVHPVLLLPPDTPVLAALERAAGREVLVTAAHGAVTGVVDLPRALIAARAHPDRPVGDHVLPVGPEQVILSLDTFREVMEVMGASGADHHLVIGPDGQVSGLLRRTAVQQAWTGGMPGAG